MAAPKYNCPFSATAATAGGDTDSVMACTDVRESGQAKATLLVNMTDATADLTYTAADYGYAGNDVTVMHADPSANDATLAVSVVGTDIIVSLATDGAGAITSTAAQVKTAILASEPATALVTVEDEGAGSGVVNATAETPLAGGAYHGCPFYSTGAEDCNLALNFAKAVLIGGGATPDEG